MNKNKSWFQLYMGDSHLHRETFSLHYHSYWDLSVVSESSLEISRTTQMESNKEWIENLEASMGGLQDSVSQLKVGMVNKLRLIEENLQRLSIPWRLVERVSQAILLGTRGQYG